MWLPFLLLGAVMLMAGKAAAIALSGRVAHRERAAGVHPSLQQLLDDWEREGTHRVQIAGGEGWPYPGGLRTDESSQVAAAAQGLSSASALRDTPHGRGAALDVWPEGFDPYTAWDEQPDEVKQQFSDFGTWAEGKGFTWGGRWSSAAFPNGDQPHVEVQNWRALPFPPPDYARGAS